MGIREPRETDNEALAKVIRDVFVEYNAPQNGTVYSDPTTNNLFDLFRADKSVLWVAEINNEVVGCCGIYPTLGLPVYCAELVKFYLCKKARGIGVGKRLMEQSIASAIAFGYKELYIESLPDFFHAVNIYKKQGFIQLDKPLGASGHTTCNIWMLKKL